MKLKIRYDFWITYMKSINGLTATKTVVPKCFADLNIETPEKFNSANFFGFSGFDETMWDPLITFWNFFSHHIKA